LFTDPGHSFLFKAARQVRQFYASLRKQRFFKIFGVTCALILYGALAIFFTERFYETKGAGGLFDALYWAVVTIATVGYGDIVPTTTAGKVFALMIILSGPALLSLVTASIASAFVERKIREGKGLESIKGKDHIVICGWNEHAETVLEGLIFQTGGHPPKIVLINELSRDEVQSIQYRYKEHDLVFLRGNFVKEDVLARADLPRAAAAIVLADTSGGHSLEKADERTIFATMAIKSMASKVRTCAELIHEENREHLLRANVDEVIVRGESAGSLIATAALSPGVVDSVRLLVENRDENRLWRIPLPAKYVGRPASECTGFLRGKYQALLLAVVREKEKIRLEDILTGDSTFVDDFIRRKFEESGKDYFSGKKDFAVQLNPPDDYLFHKNDWLVVVSKKRPRL